METTLTVSPFTDTDDSGVLALYELGRNLVNIGGEGELTVNAGKALLYIVKELLDIFYDINFILVPH